MHDGVLISIKHANSQMVLLSSINLQTILTSCFVRVISNQTSTWRSAINWIKQLIYLLIVFNSPPAWIFQIVWLRLWPLWIQHVTWWKTHVRKIMHVWQETLKKTLCIYCKNKVKLQQNQPVYAQSSLFSKGCEGYYKNTGFFGQQKRGK